MSEKKIHSLFTKTSSIKKSNGSGDESTDDEIVFLAEFDLKGIEKSPKADDVQNPSASLNQSLTYTQEQDATSDFDDDEDSIFDGTKLDTVKLDNKDDQNDDEEDEDEEIKLIYDSKALLDQIDGKLRSIVVDLTTDDEIEVEANKPKKTCLKKRPTDISPIVCKKSQNKINNYFSPQILRSKSAGPYLNPIDTFVFKEDTTEKTSLSSDEDDLLLLTAADQAQNQYEINKSLSMQENKDNDEKMDEEPVAQDKSLDKTLEEETPDTVLETPTVDKIDLEKFKHLSETVTDSGRKIEFASDLNMTGLYSVNFHETEDKIEIKINESSSEESLVDSDMPNLSSSKISENRMKRLRELQTSSSSSEEQEIPKTIIKKKSLISSSDDDDDYDDDSMPLEQLVHNHRKKDFSLLKHISKKNSSKPPPSTTESKFSATTEDSSIPVDLFLNIPLTEDSNIPVTEATIEQQDKESTPLEEPLQDGPIIRSDRYTEHIQPEEEFKNKALPGKEINRIKSVSGESLVNKRATKLIEIENPKRSKLISSVQQQHIINTPTSSNEKDDEQRPSSKKKIRLTSPDRFDLNCRKRLINDDNIPNRPLGIENVSKKTSDVTYRPLGIENVSKKTSDVTYRPLGIQNVSKKTSDVANSPLGIENVSKKSTVVSNSSLNKNPMQSSANKHLNPIDTEKRQMLKRIGTTYNINKPKQSKAFADLKRLKSREMAAIKFRKPVTYENDMNLTQITNLAKQENLARIKAAKILENERNQKASDKRDCAPDNSSLTSLSNSKSNYIEKEPEQHNPIRNKISTELNSNSNNITKKTSELSEPHLIPHIKKSDLIQKNPRETIKKSTTNINKENVGIKISNSGNDNAPKQQIQKPKSSKTDVVAKIMNNMDKQQTEMVAVNERLQEDEFKYHLNHFFYRLLKCTFNWLIEQEHFTEPPPVVEDSEMTPLIDLYVNYDDYYKAMFPLLLLETWEEITRAWKEITYLKMKTEERPMWLKCMEREDKLTKITMQTIVKPQQYGPQAEDLYRINVGLLVEKVIVKIDYFAMITKSVKLRPNDEKIMKEVKKFMVSMDGIKQTIQPVYTESSPMKTVVQEKSFHGSNVYEIQFYVRTRKYSIDIGEKFTDYTFITNIGSSLRRVKALVQCRRSKIIKNLLNPSSSDAIFRTSYDSSVSPIVQDNSDCNEVQREVVKDAASIVTHKDSKFCFVQGPPGTGKTKTIINIIKIIAYFIESNLFNERKMNNTSVEKINPLINLKILICSPSNSNCDEITRRVVHFKNRTITRPKGIKTNFQIVRLCSNQSLNREFEEFSLDVLSKKKYGELLSLKQCDKSSSLQIHYKSLKNTEVVLAQKIELIKKSKQSESIQVQLKELEEQHSELLKKKKDFENKMKKTVSAQTVSITEQKKLEQQAREEVVRSADIIICTLNYSGNAVLDCLTEEKNNGKCPISAIIIDEAAQCLEVDFLIPLRFGCTKFIQVGDPEQLPATVLAKRASSYGLGQSFFERIYQGFRFSDKNPIKMLYVQYRMHEAICRFPSKTFYKGKLKTDDEIATKRNVAGLDAYKIFDITDSKELSEQNTDSIYNQIEANCVMEYCKIIQNKFNKMMLGIITPYKRQCHHIKSLVRNYKLDNVEVGTVDSFQGREKDIIFISTVRANDKNQIGFLSHRQRLNVLLTRAKYALYIFCHKDTLKSNKDWRECIDDANARKHLQSISSKSFKESLIQESLKTTENKDKPQENNQKSVPSFPLNRDSNHQNEKSSKKPDERKKSSSPNHSKSNRDDKNQKNSDRKRSSSPTNNKSNRDDKNQKNSDRKRSSSPTNNKSNREDNKNETEPKETKKT